MPFIPHTQQDVKEMLETIGVKKIEDLFDEIPSSLRKSVLEGIPAGVSEMELGRIIRERAQQDISKYCFIGAGAYEHHIPAVVSDLTSRGEFYTAYTPYQAEASQGNLQLIYEYQTMMASLMSLDISNASLYDGASALSEAILMAARLSHKKEKMSILLPKTVHPFYRETVQTIVQQQHIQIIEIPYLKETGQVDADALKKCMNNSVVAMVIPQPNFFGVLEEVDKLAQWAHEQNILSIALVNPLAMALLKPPGLWGEKGVDIACGDGQPLGIPLSSGGPYYGFLCCKKKYVRQMPGRLVGRTKDLDGKPGFVLTLQAREQHIRRAKATSNICTNQGLMVTASTIYMSLLGPEGLRRVAAVCHERARTLKQLLTMIPGIKPVFHAPFFHEIVLQMDQPADHVIRELAQIGIQAGFMLEEAYPELTNCLLVCVTETKTEADIQMFAYELQEVLHKKKPLERSKLVCQG